MHNGGTWTWWGEYRTWECASYGPFLDPEAYFIWRLSESFGLSIGMQMSVAFIGENWNGYSGDWTPGMSGAAFIGIVI
jgi:hypothetical protein